MGFQAGDGAVSISGKAVTLRLTLGALAEISTRMSLFGPDALMQGLRALQPEDGRLLLECLMLPDLPHGDARALAAELTMQEIAALLPAVCEIFEQAFSSQKM